MLKSFFKKLNTLPSLVVTAEEIDRNINAPVPEWGTES